MKIEMLPLEGVSYGPLCSVFRLCSDYQEVQKEGIDYFLQIVLGHA